MRSSVIRCKRSILPRWLQSSATISLDDTQGTEGSAAEGLDEGGTDWVAAKELKLSYHNGYIYST